MESVRQFRVFISSPEDVREERAIACQILSALPSDPLLLGRVAFQVVAWDHPDGSVPLLANMTPQEAVSRELPKPSECDVVVVILWARMGTPLTEEFRKPDGNRYLSGTEWEYEDALVSKRPIILIYRKKEPPRIDLDDPEYSAKRTQYERVKSFFAQFVAPDGSIRQGVNTYLLPGDFRKQFENDIKRVVNMLQATPAEVPSTDRQNAVRAKAPTSGLGTPTRYVPSSGDTSHPGGVLDLTYSPDGNLLATAGSDGHIRFWDGDTGASAGLVRASNRPIYAICFNKTGTVLACAGLDSGTIVLETSSNNVRRILGEQLDSVLCLAFNPCDPEVLATAGHAGSIRMWNIVTGECISTWESGQLHDKVAEPRIQSAIHSLAFSPDGLLLVSAGRESVTVWRLPNAKPTIQLHSRFNLFQSICFDSNGATLAGGGRNSKIMMWNTREWSPVRTLSYHTRSVFCVRFSPDGSILASAGGDGAICICSVLTWDSYKTVAADRGSVTALAFHPTGMILASGCNDGSILTWIRATTGSYSPRFLRYRS